MCPRRLLLPVLVACACLPASLGGEEKKDLTPEEKAALVAGDREMRQQHDEAVKRALDEQKKALREAKGPSERAAAVWRLGDAERDPRIVAELVRSLGESELVRQEAVAALGRYRGDKTAAQALAGALASSRTPAATERILAALASVGHESCVPAVVKLIADKEPRVAAAAVHALGEANAAAAVEPLLALWEALDRDRQRSGDTKREAEDRLKVAERPLKDALAKLTGQAFGGPAEGRAWWAQNRAAYKPKEEPPPVLCRHMDPLHHPFKAAPPGAILREVWTGIGGGSVGDLTRNERFKGEPGERTLISSFEVPRDVADDYGTRVRGFLIAPADGGYEFAIAADDSAELHLSPSDEPVRKIVICRQGRPLGRREFDKTPEQRSKTILLNAGRRYYIEALHKEGGGGDHLAVAWQLPGATRLEIIPGRCLAPCLTRDEAASLKVLPPVDDNLAAGRLEAPPAAVPVDLAGLVASTSPARYAWDTLRKGLLLYVDRDYPYVEVASCAGLPVLRTACDDKKAAGDAVIAFDLKREATVLVGLENRVEKPSWMSSFTDTGESLSGRHKEGPRLYRLWARDYPPGRVALGGVNTGFAMYVVVLRPKGGAALVAGSTSAPAGLAKPAGTFYRAVNLNGPELAVDGNRWESGAEAENCLAFGRPVETRAAPLAPAVDDVFARVLRTAVRVEGSGRIVLAGVPSGMYRVFLYVRDSTSPFAVALQGAPAGQDLAGQAAGEWRRLGPWDAEVRDGALTLEVSGAAVQLCAIEVWEK
jgi:hypothetical protein